MSVAPMLTAAVLPSQSSSGFSRNTACQAEILSSGGSSRGVWPMLYPSGVKEAITIQ